MRNEPRTFKEIREELRLTFLAEKLIGTRDSNPTLFVQLFWDCISICLDYPHGKTLDSRMFPEFDNYEKTVKLLSPSNYGNFIWDLERDHVDWKVWKS